LNFFSLEEIVLQTIQESKETNNMIKKIMDTEKQEIENIIRNNEQVILKLDLIITEIKKEKLDNIVEKLSNTDFNKGRENPC
jgi:hypothetical protein